MVAAICKVEKFLKCRIAIIGHICSVYLAYYVILAEFSYYSKV